MFRLSPRRLHSLFIAPALIPFLMLFNFGASDNHPPVAVDDSYSVHGCGLLHVTANDSDPDNDPIAINAFPTVPTHGSVFNQGNGNVTYCPNIGYVGADSFVYQICDPQNACATATVSVNVMNQPPNGVTDFYNIHGTTVIGPFLANDSDPDGDGITCGNGAHECILTFPQHGNLTGVATDRWSYGPALGYTGSDSFTYNVCDDLGLCTPTTVNLSVNNNAPIAGDDQYTIPGPSTRIGPLRGNDSDPDGDSISEPNLLTFPQHGSLSGLTADIKLYAYDNLNRLTTIVYPTRTVTYGYDPLHNLTRATNENGSIYIGYDNRYRVSSFSDPFYYGISYNYDTVGNRSKLKVNGGTYATYTYDAVNRLTSLKDGANLNFAYSYDAASRLTSRNAPNGVTSSYGYDDLNRLTSLMHTKGATLSGNLYSYNSANNISSWTTASDQRAYTYDPLDRLTGVSNFETPTENYSYDAVGNRTASHRSASYGYQPINKLTSTANATYSYDNNGNLLSKTDSSGTTTFAWNEESQPTQAALPNGLTANYKYDGLGRRIQRTTTAGASERYVYDGSNVLIDLNADWSVATTYFNDLGIDNHLRQTNSSTGVSYFLSDHLGSTSALTDVGGNVVEQTSYDSFGNSSGSTRTRYGYTGRERDPDTSQIHYRARWYDAESGRFASEDPIGFRGRNLNAYPYVGSNPVNEDDPFGLQGRPRHVSDKIFPPGWSKPLSEDQPDKLKEAYDIARQRLDCDEDCRKAVMRGLPGDPRTILSSIKSKGNVLFGGPNPSQSGETTAEVYLPTVGMGPASIIILYQPFFGETIFGLTIPPVAGLPGFDAAHARAVILLHELRHAVTGGVHPKDGSSNDWDKEIFEACFRKYL